jgi:hypothetical protein
MGGTTTMNTALIMKIATALAAVAVVVVMILSLSAPPATVEAPVRPVVPGTDQPVISTPGSGPAPAEPSADQDLISAADDQNGDGIPDGEQDDDLHQDEEDGYIDLDASVQEEAASAAVREFLTYSSAEAPEARQARLAAVFAAGSDWVTKLPPLARGSVSTQDQGQVQVKVTSVDMARLKAVTVDRSLVISVVVAFEDVSFSATTKPLVLKDRIIVEATFAAGATLPSSLRLL